MRAASFELAAELFDWLRAVPPGEREELLRRTPGVSGELRETVLALLAHDSPTGAFLGRPVEGATLQMLSALAAVGVPERIGRFRLVRTLGQGGFATVFLAEQESPRRHVALKLVRPGAGLEERRRLLFEAEALARLDHPGIARVYESGLVGGEDGAAYIAMELVEGVPLHEHLRGRYLPQKLLLELLIRLVEAVEHAHIRGVVHRDLAPKNILVCADGSPKVIDFGLARELRERDGLSRAVTMPGSVLGTLRYMSPEQLGGDGAGADTRADLYALGVIAYEVLAGGHPYLRGNEPLGEAVTRLQQSPACRASELDRRAGPELDAVLLKAVERERDRRYQTAGALAADLRNLAADRPVSARPAGVLSRSLKFCRRNRRAVAVAAAVAFGGSGAGAWVVEANREREQSRMAAANAMEAMVSRLLGPLASRIGTLAEREELLLSIEPHIERLYQEAPADERLLRLFGAYWVQLGDVHREQSRFGESRAALARGVNVLRTLGEGTEAELEDMHQLSLATVKLGDAELLLGRASACKALYEEALRLDKLMVARAPKDAGALSNLFWSYRRLAGQEEHQSPAAAQRYRALAAVTAERMTVVVPSDWRAWEALAQSRMAQAIAASRTGGDVQASIDKAIEAVIRLVSLDGGSIINHRTLIEACRLGVSCAISRGDRARGRELLALAEQSAEAIAVGAADEYVEYISTSALDESRSLLAEIEGDHAAALKFVVRRLEVLERRIAAVPYDEDAISNFLSQNMYRASLLERLGRSGEAALIRAALVDGAERLAATSGSARVSAMAGMLRSSGGHPPAPVLVGPPMLER